MRLLQKLVPLLPLGYDPSTKFLWRATHELYASFGSLCLDSRHG
ncbi:hypothetical protein CBM2608_B30107 [Cupriavidus taiwanensis]|nr:hypothetical protein CBM2608_B30107 [Cupriavidus taiwanensis]